MKIVIATNAFKNALPADAAARALRRGILQSGFRGIIHCCPVGDGGDGTGALLQQHLGAKKIYCNTTDALQRPIKAAFGLTQCNTAIIELADTCGLRLLMPQEYNPLIANTKGLGFMIKAALDKGAKKIILCIGGSATIDGGAGVAQALGIVFKNTMNTFISEVPLGLADLKSIDTNKMDQRLRLATPMVLCDVKNKLLGKNGAAAVFGPQKGANEFDIKFLEKCLTRFDNVVYSTTQHRMRQMPHSGAAGGVAAALCAFFEAKAVNGISTFLQMIDFESQIKNARLVVTGEGTIDHQTTDGKAPAGVAAAAKKMGIPVVAVAGKIKNAESKILKKYFDELICINPPGIAINTAIKNTEKNLVLTGKMIGRKYGGF